jgi:hypothetical protein
MSDSTRCQRPRTWVSPAVNVVPMMLTSPRSTSRFFSSKASFSRAGSVQGMT